VLLRPISIMEGRFPFMKFVHLLTRKLVAFALVSVAIVGGATAVFAATPARQSLAHTITGSVHATTAPDGGHHENNYPC